MAKFTVSLRGGFSDRNKIKEENTTIQIDDLDQRTRVALCNAASFVVSKGVLYNRGIRASESERFMKQILSDVYGQVVDWNRSSNESAVVKMILDTIETDEYDAVLTVVEYLANEVDEIASHGFVFENTRYYASNIFNQVFEKEYVGYRFVNGYITPITDSVEISTIEDASASCYDEVRVHVDKALRFLSDRDTPDYANSIKESISAVERMCSIIIGKPTTLGSALKKLEDSGIVIHAALKSAFEKLYGYTSDASGIRHAGELGGKSSTFEEAKFMLVSCCAFINYLTGVMAKTP